MNPLSLKMTAIAVVVASAVAFGAAWKVQGWRLDASLKEAAEAARIAQEQAISDHAAKQRSWETQLGILTGQRDAALVELTEIQNRPVTPIVYRDKVMPDGHTCPDPRIGPDVWVVLNDAAAAADRAVPRETD